MDDNAMTVTALNNRIKLLIDCDSILTNVLVKGEISNYKVYPSGHHYFTLKDSDSSIRCVLFRTYASKLRFKPENGMGVVAFGRVSVYSKEGVYQLYVSELMSIGVGNLHLEYENLKAKLCAEGLFEDNHKKQLPHFPNVISIITSPAGAAIHDMIRILGKRWPLAKIVLLPVRVQGEEAPLEIVGAINYANKYHIGDILIVGRGGGSIEDLWAFNDELVARAIYSSEIPIISAVGHEPDITISDYVADVRASTPSNAAEIAVPDIYELYELLRAFDERQNLAMTKILTNLSVKLSSLSSRRVLCDPASYIYLRSQELDSVCTRLISAIDKTISEKRRELVRLASKLDALSPMKVLMRGYAIVEGAKNGIIRSAKEVQLGDTLKLTFNDGNINCYVTDIEEKTDE